MFHEQGFNLKCVNLDAILTIHYVKPLDNPDFIFNPNPDI